MPRLRVPVAVPRTKGLVAVPRPELASGYLFFHRVDTHVHCQSARGRGSAKGDEARGQRAAAAAVRRAPGRLWRQPGPPRGT